MSRGRWCQWIEGGWRLLLPLDNHSPRGACWASEVDQGAVLVELWRCKSVSRTGSDFHEGAGDIGGVELAAGSTKAIGRLLHSDQPHDELLALLLFHGGMTTVDGEVEDYGTATPGRLQNIFPPVLGSEAMKGQSDKTKVVVRRLPPTISQATLMEQIDSSFAGRYSWVAFRTGKSSQKHQSYSRAYIDFKTPEDVIEFAEFFNGHMFVNEKGTQFKAVVEYAPSQRVPKHLSKKDGREGTISKDPEYLQFLEAILKPVENLPSAEIQLERRDAERAGAAKDAVIVTPLMEFIRQKRAAKNGSRRILANGKPSRRSLASGSPSSSSSKRGSDKKRTSTMYVLRDSTKGASGKDKSTYTLVSKRDDHQLSGKVVTSASGPEGLEDRSAIAGMTDGGKKRILLLKGKEKEISSVSGGPISQQNAISSEKHATSSGKQNHRREPSGRIVRSILLKEPRQSSGALSEQQIHSSHVERDKRPPRPLQGQLVLKDANGTPDDRVSGNDTHSFPSEKQHDKRTRNKDRPDRVVWTPLRRSDGSYASDESLGSQSTVSGMDFSQGSAGDVKVDMTSRSEVKGLGSDRNSHTSLDNGWATQSQKQVWVQKSSSGS
ncbi:unnamed protein product [Linum tenue]|uniref:UPF3 domain-containing protein n=1 Tax=Linum tenue TaxID=586396 RepID=A0AAV0M129_9ROSI|nr:unnamed protein product [Linum tenue]